MPSTICPFTLFHEECVVAGVRENSSGKESLKKGLSNLMGTTWVFGPWFKWRRCKVQSCMLNFSFMSKCSIHDIIGSFCLAKGILWNKSLYTNKSCMLKFTEGKNCRCTSNIWIDLLLFILIGYVQRITIGKGDMACFGFLKPEVMINFTKTLELGSI